MDTSTLPLNLKTVSALFCYFENLKLDFNHKNYLFDLSNIFKFVYSIVFVCCTKYIKW